MEKTPALFIGHGSPMNTLERNIWTDAWRGVAATLPKPRAILVISAHWYIEETMVTAMAHPRTIHDFHGFPEALFNFQYPAPGAPALAEEVADLAQPDRVGADPDQWGIDHGAWSVLAHLYPDADIPVAQLSINAAKPMDYHVALGAKLAPLRERGVLILASGNVVHNLRRIDWQAGNSGADWAQRFDDAVEAQMQSNPEEILRVTKHPDYAVAVPSPDHFIPLLYIAGLAAAAGARPDVFAKGYALGSLSMTSYRLG